MQCSKLSEEGCTVTPDKSKHIGKALDANDQLAPGIFHLCTLLTGPQALLPTGAPAQPSLTLSSHRRDIFLGRHFQEAQLPTRVSEAAQLKVGKVSVTFAHLRCWLPGLRQDLSWGTCILIPGPGESGSRPAVEETLSFVVRQT